MSQVDHQHGLASCEPIGISPLSAEPRVHEGNALVAEMVIRRLQ